jgi:2-amino-4-hydroxy-6-hydroxymethyldihydropteridine diphosphokinase
MTKALLSLGSNLGDRLGYLRSAATELGDAVVSASKIYETPPWPPGEEAPMYLNAVIMVEDVKTDAYGWLSRTQTLEQTAGRDRNPSRQYAPRTLDVDVIMVWDDDGRSAVSNDPELILPHPRAYLRAFVLRPWLDVQPDGEIPGYGTLVDLLQNKSVASDLQQIHQINEGF